LISVAHFEFRLLRAVGFSNGSGVDAFTWTRN